MHHAAFDFPVGLPGMETDDPIRRIPSPAVSTARAGAGMLGCLVLGVGGGLALMAALGLFIAGRYAWSGGLVAAALGPLLIWGTFSASARMKRAIRRYAPGLTFDLQVRPGDDGRPYALRVPLGQTRPAPTPFDPADAAQREAMDALWRARIWDAIHLEPGGAHDPRSGATLVGDPDGGRGQRPIRVRLEAILRVVAFLDARPDPRSAWLAAMAGAETVRWTRAREALEQLADVDPDTRDRLVAWLADHGPAPARAAAAMAEGDVARMDALIAAPDGLPYAARGDLMRARWMAAPAPDLLERWCADPELSIWLAGLDLPDAGLDHWLRLANHPEPEVAARGIERALRVPDAAIPAARALLDRDDLRRRFEALGDRHVGAIRAALDHLGHVGAVEDLRRLGRWGGVSGPLGGFARAQRDRLEMLVGRPDASGGLALAAEGPAGALSAADDEQA